MLGKGENNGCGIFALQKRRRDRSARLRRRWLLGSLDDDLLSVPAVLLVDMSDHTVINHNGIRLRTFSVTGEQVHVDGLRWRCPDEDTPVLLMIFYVAPSSATPP